METCMHLENIPLSEISQTKTSGSWYHLYVVTEKISQSQKHRVKSGCRGLRSRETWRDW